MQDTIDNLEGEIWKDIPGYEGKYRICNIGNKIKYYGDNKIFDVPIFTNNRYISTTLRFNGTKKHFYLHRIKAITFIPNNENKSQVNHIDGNKHNNELDNLEWCTASENIKHSHKIGLCAKNKFVVDNPMKGKFGEKNRRAKKVIQLTKNGYIIKTWGSIIDAERELQISHISLSCKEQHRTAGGYKWRYVI